jgi:hypothetical protein
MPTMPLPIDRELKGVIGDLAFLIAQLRAENEALRNELAQLQAPAPPSPPPAEPPA